VASFPWELVLLGWAMVLLSKGIAKKFEVSFSLAEKLDLVLCFDDWWCIRTCARNLGQRSCCSCGPQWRSYFDRWGGPAIGFFCMGLWHFWLLT
jgi:hypothetical protein